MPNLSTRFARFFSNEPESREQQNSTKFTGNDLFTGLGGSYYAANTNRDLQANEYGYAQASQVLVDINASLNYWEQWLDGLVWEVKDSNTGELLVDTSERGYDASARGATVYYALKRYRDRFKHSYWKSLVTSDFVAGETYVYLAGSPKLTDVQWLNPLNTTPQIISGRIEYYQYTGMDSTPATLPVDRVAYRMMRRNLFDDLRGYSSILSVLDEVNLSRNAKRAFRKYFQNGMILGGIISPDGETSWTPREREQVEKDLLRNNSGMANAHNWVIAPKKIFAEAFTQSDSGQNLEALNTLSQYIASAMGVPRILYGDPADATYQNLKEAKKMWWETRGIPYARDIATYHNNQIIPRLEPDSGIYIEPKTAPYEVEAPDVVSQDVNAGYISISTAQAKRGYDVDSTLDNVYLFGGLPYRLQDGAFVPMVSMVTDTPDAVEDTEDVITDALEDVQADTEPTRGAPANTTFERYQYNGVEFYASPIAPSSRDDKKYQRYVHTGNEDEARIVHFGSPDMDMERDVDSSRENFNSRFKCDTRKDPYSPVFHACLAWKPSTEIPGGKSQHPMLETFAPLHDDAESELPHSKLFNPDVLYDIDDIDTRLNDELMTWYKFAKNRYTKSDTRTFQSDILEPYIRYAVIDRLQGIDALEALKSAILDVLDDDTVKTVSAYRRKVRSLFYNLAQGNIQTADFINGMSNLIKQQYTQAFKNGVKRAGKVLDDLSGDERAELDLAIIEEQSNAFGIMRDIIADRAQDDLKLADYRRRAELWIARYDRIDDLGFIVAMQDTPLLWERNPLKESCRDCIALDGKIYPASKWKAIQIEPRSPRLKCFGAYCGCTVKPAPEGAKLSRGRVPNIG